MDGGGQKNASKVPAKSELVETRSFHFQTSSKLLYEPQEVV